MLVVILLIVLILRLLALSSFLFSANVSFSQEHGSNQRRKDALGLFRSWFLRSLPLGFGCRLRPLWFLRRRSDSSLVQVFFSHALVHTQVAILVVGCSLRRSCCGVLDGLRKLCLALVNLLLQLSYLLLVLLNLINEIVFHFIRLLGESLKFRLKHSGVLAAAWPGCKHVL